MRMNTYSTRPRPYASMAVYTVSQAKPTAKYMATPARRPSPRTHGMVFATAYREQHPLLHFARQLFAIISPDEDE